MQVPLQNYKRQKDEIKSLTENPQILGAVLQNLVTWTTCNPDTLQQYICVCMYVCIYIYMYIYIYIHSNFLLPSAIGSLVILIKPQDK